MAGFDVDVSDLDRFARDLVASADGVLAAVRPAVAKGAVNVKASMREDMAQSAHFGQVASSITYDTRVGAGWVEAEVGPKTAGRVVGDLAHFAYFGTPNGGGNTVRDPQANLDEEAPRFVAAVADVVGGLLD